MGGVAKRRRDAETQEGVLDQSVTRKLFLVGKRETEASEKIL